ncbi:egg cell-secreted protein 1.3 [Ziziphus jujuba]|uniref:Egg cell-secreted protein 1.3 n=1 Tax=Ziziphus jujuba TaxID=326968 RepID=A0A6P4AKT0_ZIZJJ|nr:egg cell-secreted protein 1.3 [Ziziphus jujuba]
MASTLNNMFVLMTSLVVLTISFPSIAKAARPLNHIGSNLAARLKLEDGSSTCWESLLHLQSCTGEVVLFFLNGETSLGPACCKAIRIIEHECWPDMLSSLGFTTEEGDILQGYCDAASVHSPPAQNPPLLPPPPPPPAVKKVAVGDVTSGNLVP